MPNIEGDTFRGFYKSEIEKNQKAIFAIPDNIRVINFIFFPGGAETQRDVTIDELIIGPNVLSIADYAFDWVNVKNVYISSENYNYDKYLTLLCNLMKKYNVTGIKKCIENIYIVEKTHHPELDYTELDYDEDSIYTGTSIINSEYMIAANYIDGRNAYIKVYDGVPSFNQKNYFTFNAKNDKLPLFFKIKKDIDGYLFAEDVITKKNLPIIYYKNEYLQQSNAIKRMGLSAGITFGSIKLTTPEEISYISKLESFKGRKLKKKYIELINKIDSNVEYTRKVDFGTPIVIESIGKLRKSDIIEDVRTLLLKISDINTEVYREYYGKFKDILNLTNTQDIESKLINLSAELQLYLSCGVITFSENSNLVDNINNLTSNYYDRLVNNSGSEVDIVFKSESIDVLANLVIKNINNMSYLEVDNISKNIAFMYFAEIKLARENEGIVDFKNNPYLEYFKKYIYYIIKTMLINGYVKLDIDIDIENTDLIRLIEDANISELKQDIKKKLLTFDIN